MNKWHGCHLNIKLAYELGNCIMGVTTTFGWMQLVFAFVSQMYIVLHCILCGHPTLSCEICLVSGDNKNNNTIAALSCICYGQVDLLPVTFQIRFKFMTSISVISPQWRPWQVVFQSFTFRVADDFCGVNFY